MPIGLPSSPIPPQGYLLDHGSEYWLWATNIRRLIALRGAATRNFVEGWRGMQIPTSDQNSEALSTIMTMISKPLLDRIPDSSKATAKDLLGVLPTYSKPFRLLDLPPELRTCIYRATELPPSHDILNIYPDYFNRRIGVQVLHKDYLIIPYPPLLHVNSQIRREAIPALIPNLTLSVSQPTSPDPVMSLTSDTTRYLTSIDFRPPVKSGFDFLLMLRLKPNTTLQYDLLCRRSMGRWREHELCPSWKQIILARIHTYGLHIAMPWHRGVMLLAFVENISCCLDVAEQIKWMNSKNS